MKKVLHLSNNFLPFVQGGIENTIKEIISFSLNNNDVLCMNNFDHIKKYNKSIVFYKKSNFKIFQTNFSINFILFLFKIFRKYDFIVVHSPQPFVEILSLFLKKKVIIFYHSDIINQKIINFFYSPIRSLVLNKCYKIITSSNKYLKTSNVLSNFKYKTQIWNLSISKKFSLKKYNKIKLPKKYFIFIGSNRSYKGFSKLFEVFKNKNLSHLNLVVIGQGFEKYEKNSNKNIIFLGQVGDNYKNFILKNSFCLILPSLKRNEAYGLVLVEALRLGIPLITTKLGTATDFINKNRVTGFTIKPNNNNEMIKTILKFENMCSKEYKLLKINSKKRFYKFCIEDNILFYDKVFE